MPGVRDGNLRSGDKNEEFGLRELGELAFIAPVPRPDDVGIDAVVTLIRRSGRRLYAEDSFTIQAKSCSKRVIEYGEQELNWLRAQILPLYILSADRRTQVVELYSTVRAMGHPNICTIKRLALHLDKMQMSVEGDALEIWLGPPILRWTAPQATDLTFQNTAYNALKVWVGFETSSISLRPLGMFRQLQWRTNEVPTHSGAYMIMGPGPIQQVLEAICPHIQRLIAEVFPHESMSDKLAFGLLSLCEYMRDNGVDPDPSGLLPKLVGHALQSRTAARGDSAPQNEPPREPEEAMN